jgi:hypothetical protein
MRLPPWTSSRELLVFDGLSRVFGDEFALSFVALVTGLNAAGARPAPPSAPPHEAAIAKLRCACAKLRAEHAAREALIAIERSASAKG